MGSIRKMIYTFAHITNMGLSVEEWWDLRIHLINGDYKGLKLKLNRCKYYDFMAQNCASIPLETWFEEMPRFPHGIHGIHISSAAKLYGGVVMFQNVTIGSNTLKGSHSIGAPVIERNVFIGSGANIIGRITVGAGTRVGAGCIVYGDIEKNSTVVMESQRVIHHDGERDNTFIPMEANRGN